MITNFYYVRKLNGSLLPSSLILYYFICYKPNYESHIQNLSANGVYQIVRMFQSRTSGGSFTSSCPAPSRRVSPCYGKRKGRKGPSRQEGG